MTTCASCGQANPPEARFCLACGSPLTTGRDGAAVRKTVTIIFADISGSTNLGERLDPESTRQVMAEYFAAMRAVLERHGGTVEKFIGDAVMAVFGVPTLHEDDALRAVRAAVGMRSELARLNAGPFAERGVRLEMRIGVNTGEVVAGQRGQTLVTGDAVNVAARLEQAAQPDEILIGASTERLVRSSVAAEPVPPLQARGKSEPLSAHRLTDLAAPHTDPVRHLDTPLVGRERELDLLRHAFDRTRDEQACFLFTVLGSAGVGKSRLVHEFVSEVRDRAIVLHGRCLPYGDGITFWPVGEIVKSAAGVGEDDDPIEAQAKIRRRVANDGSADLIAARLADVIGVSSESRPTEELFWGVRRFLEALAIERPVVIVVDDLQWAEPTLLDLVEHTADWSREAPVMLVCLARPELLETRPSWGGGKLNATSVLLEPLSNPQAEQLIANLLGGTGLPQELERRVTETAEGNPLFVEEFVGMLIDDGLLRPTQGSWEATGDLSSLAVPSSIHALVSARLDRLDEPARDLIGRASVVGKVFQRAAVVELSPPDRRDQVPAHLLTLVRREIVRPDRSTGLDDAYRFRHILVRDAAYGALPKEQRSELHERFADWLEEAVGERVAEYEEILGYHLEQAYRYRLELAPPTDEVRRLGERAAAYVSTAGARAFDRGDMAAAMKLLARAAELLPSGDPRRGDLLIDAAIASQGLGRLELHRDLVARGLDEARSIGDERLSHIFEVVDAFGTAFFPSGGDSSAIREAVERARPLVAAPDDHLGRAIVWLATSEIHLVECQWAVALEAAEKGMAETAALRAPALRRMLRGRAANALTWGPVPADEALPRLEELAEDAPDGRIWGLGVQLYAMLGRIDEARERVRIGRAIGEEYGLEAMLGGLALSGADAERVAGNLEAAERELRYGIGLLERLGETGVRSTLEGELAWNLARQSRLDEAASWAARARQISQDDDIASQVDWRAAVALVAARRGDLTLAQRSVHEAIGLIEPTDFLEKHAETRLVAAIVAEANGDRGAAREERDRALALFEAKHDWVSAERVRAMLSASAPGADPG